MFLLLLHPPRKSPSLFSLLSTDIAAAAAASSSSLMASKHLLKDPPLCQPIPSSSSSSSSVRLFHAYKINSCHCPSKPMSSFRLSCVKTNGSPYSSQASIPRPVHLETAGDNNSVIAALNVLKKKLEELDMDLKMCQPGQYNSLLCPMCKGGNTMEKSLSLYISPDGASALWKCFRGKCGWKGSTKAFANRMSCAVPSNLIEKTWRDISVQSLDLQPLCTELVAYFAERLISAQTLSRNAVMQKKWNNQIVIAFTYRRKGKLVSCKYRDVNKKFWQEADTEKIFYGLDDIEGQRDIIIVEGEMDKLAMEEAGFRNCVSVPDGAPPTVSQKDLPTEEHDTKYQYLWNCKDYLKDVSRIILATDGDPPGQALAEELARRLGKERCWRVRWPRKSDSGYFKDANEVFPGHQSF